jgi:hypothetical protein
MQRLWCISALFLALALWSCERSENNFRNDYRWISGKWQGVEDGVLVMEQWKWNKFRFEGHGYNVIDGDTVMHELLFLEDFGGYVAYSAVVNGKGPYTFGLKSSSDGVYEFSNEDHDFPSIIRYGRDSDNSLTVSLLSQSSPFEGNVSFQLKRTK